MARSKIQKWEEGSVMQDSEGWLQSRVCHCMHEFWGWDQQVKPAGREALGDDRPESGPSYEN